MKLEIPKVLFKKGLTLEIEILSIADTISKHKPLMSNPHRAQFYHIYWVQKGTAHYFIDFEPVEVTANSYLFVNKDRVQVVDTNSVHDGKLLLFTDNFFGKTIDDANYLNHTILFNDLLDIPVINVTSTPSLLIMFSALETELEKENDTYHYNVLHNVLHNLLLLAERERKNQGFQEIEKGADLDYTLLFKDLLAAQFNKLKSVSAYASQMNVSEKRLTKATMKTVGKSPKKIIDERVILDAKRMLIHTNFSIKQICYNLGFDEPTNFIKYFRKHAEKTPIEFRAAYFIR